MKMKWLALGSLAALAASATASADGSSVGVGFDYSSGKYGATTTTDIWSVPFSFGYDSGPWSLKLTVPYINVSGSGNVIRAVVAAPAPCRAPTRSVRPPAWAMSSRRRPTRCTATTPPASDSTSPAR